MPQKNQEHILDTQKLKIALNWSSAADFDLAAVYESKEGKRGIVYFGELGKSDAFPYISLDKDAGIGDAKGAKAEEMNINDLALMKKLWLFCWDYNRVQSGQKARFTKGDIIVKITDDTQKTTRIDIDDSDNGNVCYFACIDSSQSNKLTLKTPQLTGTLRGLKTIEQLMALVRYQEQ